MVARSWHGQLMALDDGQYAEMYTLQASALLRTETVDAVEDWSDGDRL